MFWLKACPRCRGDLHIVHDIGEQYVTCLQCGGILTEAQESTLLRRSQLVDVRLAGARRPKVAA